jgi:hypothetical protein
MSLLIAPQSTRARKPKKAARRGASEQQLVFTPNNATSRRTGLVFEALLGAAACLSLVAVVQQATTHDTPAGSPDAAPPAVFVHTD